MLVKTEVVILLKMLFLLITTLFVVLRRKSNKNSNYILYWVRNVIFCHQNWMLLDKTKHFMS